jgi:hypothetical protein
VSFSESHYMTQSSNDNDHTLGILIKMSVEHDFFNFLKLLNLPPQTLISISWPCPLSGVCQLACLKGFFCISAFTNIIMHRYLTIQ